MENLFAFLAWMSAVACCSSLFDLWLPLWPWQSLAADSAADQRGIGRKSCRGDSLMRTAAVDSIGCLAKVARVMLDGRASAGFDW